MSTPEPTVVSAARAAMLDHRALMKAEQPEARTAGDVAPFIGEHAGEYWNWVLERYVGGERAAGGDPA